MITGDDTEPTVGELAERIIGLAGRLAAATCRWLLLVGAFDAREGCAEFGLASTARWLSHYCGLSRRTAVEHVRVARALTEHARLREEMSAGRLSYSQVRAISRLAHRGDPQLIGELIEVAQHGTVRHLEEIVRGLRSVDDVERPRPAGEREQVTHRWRGDQLWGLSARLEPEHGALVESALAALGQAENLTRPEALVRMAEIAVAALVGDGEVPSLRGDQLAAIQIRVDAADLPPVDLPTADLPRTDRLPADEPRSPERGRRPAGRIRGGPGLPQPVLDRLLCTGRIQTVVIDSGGRPLDVGQDRRLVGKRTFHALLVRDGGCAHPGCGSRAGLEAHHVVHWRAGGPTTMANLVLLCRRHHHAHHDREFTVERIGTGRRPGFRFRRRDGAELPAVVALRDPGTTPVEEEHSRVAASAPVTRWDGTRLHLDYAVAVLAPGLTSVGRRYDPWAA